MAGMGKKKQKKDSGCSKSKGNKSMLSLSSNNIGEIIDVDHDDNVVEAVNSSGLPNVIVVTRQYRWSTYLHRPRHQPRGSTR